MKRMHVALLALASVALLACPGTVVGPKDGKDEGDEGADGTGVAVPGDGDGEPAASSSSSSSSGGEAGSCEAQLEIVKAELAACQSAQK